MVVRDRDAFLVFDRPADFNLTALARLPLKATPVAAQHGAVLHLTDFSGITPDLNRERGAWVITLRPAGQAARRPAAPLPVTGDGAAIGTPAGNPAAGAADLTIGVAKASYPVTFADPASGTTMQVVAIEQPGRGIDGERRFAQFTLLPTQQGIAVAGAADGVAVRVQPTRVQVAGAITLAPPTANRSSSVFNFARWLANDIEFQETQQMLQRAAAEAEESRRNAARFELAQFYMARGFEPDAIGVLDLVARTNPALATDPALMALRGAAKVMREEGGAALQDLSDRRLDTEAEALLWRGAASAQVGAWQTADQLFRAGGAIPAGYSVLMRSKLSLLAAEAALNAGDYVRARAYVDGVTGPVYPSEVRGEAELIRAKTYLRQGDRRAAAPILARLEQSPDRRVRAHAEPVWIDEALKDQRISRTEAIDRLERLRFAWPGGELEYAVLKRLADLYAEEQDPKNALRTWREALTYFPDRPDSPALRQRMSDLFSGLYERKEDSKVSTLTALSLYDDYRDLTPGGPRGDAMIQNLADRLVQVDLLERAADLLEYQVRQRLQGVEKARVGARLAVVRLLDKQAGKALAGLDETEQANLPADLAAERRRLRARAQMEAGDAARGLVTLEGDTSRDGLLLRAEIASRAQDWGQAATVLEGLVGPASDRQMTPARERLVINLAIANALAGRQDRLRALRDQYGPLMADSNQRQAFDLLTTGNHGSAGMDMMALTVRFAELSEFQSAMTSYREKLRAGELSTIN